MEWPPNPQGPPAPEDEALCSLGSGGNAQLPQGFRKLFQEHGLREVLMGSPGKGCGIWRSRASSSAQFSSVAHSCSALCNTMDRSTPGLSVHHQLPEFTQTHVHQVADALWVQVKPYIHCELSSLSWHVPRPPSPVLGRPWSSNGTQQGPDKPHWSTLPCPLDPKGGGADTPGGGGEGRPGAAGWGVLPPLPWAE